MQHALAGRVPHCAGCEGPLKPDVVFFGEPVEAMDAALRLTAEADLFLVIGSSLAVYPAALLPQYIPSRCPLVVINRGPLSVHVQPALTFADDIDKVIDRLVQQQRLF